MNRRPPRPEPDPIPGGRAIDGAGLTRILVTGVFVLVILAVIVPGGSIGSQIRTFLSYAFGLGSYVAPVVLGAFVATALRAGLDSSFKPRRPWLIGWILVFVAAVVLFQAFDQNARDRKSVV